MSREQTSSLPKDLTSGEYCPACRSVLVNDREKGENVCPECGYVAPEPSVETSIGWKYSNDDHTRVSERSGIPSTFSLHDYGLSTDISTVGRDSHGKSLDNYSRETAERMQMWQRRIRTSASGEKSLSNALTKISEVSGQLKLPTSLIEDASLIFRKSSKQNVSKSKSIAGMAAASVYLACRHGNVNRSLSEIASAAGIQPRAAARYYRLLLNEVERNYVAPLTVQKYISKLVNKEKINARVERLALEIAQSTNESEISSGKTPAGLAAAYVYIATVMAGEHIPQSEIAQFAEVTEVTVRSRCREIVEKFTIRQKLRTQL